MKCPQCGQAMNHHANKIVLDSFDADDGYRDEVAEAFSCPHCGFNAARQIWPGETGF